jgi:hypothetical protein
MEAILKQPVHHQKTWEDSTYLNIDI